MHSFPENGADRLAQPLERWLNERFAQEFGHPDPALPPLRVTPSARPELGDYQCNDAMRLARPLRCAPREIADRLLSSPLPPFLESAGVAGAGFMNFRLNDGGLARAVEELAADPVLGIPDPGRGQTVVLDYSSPNIAKPMHIGHIRSTIIGNALDRLHRALGYRVIADNHLGDWGTQFGILIQGYRHFLDPAALADAPVEELERVYIRSYQRSREDPEWMDACRRELVKLQSGDPENRALWEQFVALSLDAFRKIYDRLDIHFELCRGESYYHEILQETLAHLDARGLTEPSEGATIVRLDDVDLPPCIVRKRDGGFNYAATDIATVRDRVREFGPAKIVYVTDERQQLHFQQFFSICRKLGIETALEHVWFGLMRLPEGTFSTRQGNVIKLDALLDEAERRALEIVQRTSPELDAATQRAVARAVGLGAVKYADLSHNPQTLVVFTWESALTLEGNSGPYLQYAHARIRSVLDKYRERFPDGDPGRTAIRFTDPLERTLTLQLLQYPGAVVRAAVQYKPSALADYLFALAQLYSGFYQQVPFLKAAEGIRESRLRLCAAVAAVLKHGLNLLGIEAPERI